jgi:hypothetical protein
MRRESRYNFINHGSPAQERNRLTDGASMAPTVTPSRSEVRVRHGAEEIVATPVALVC